MEEILFELASILILGMAAQWVGWRFRVPSILLLLIFGFVAGPITGFLDPDHLLGDLLIPIVSVSVGIILFEGGLTLDILELRQIGRVVRNLNSVSVLVTWVLSTIAARCSKHGAKEANDGATIKATPITNQDYQKHYAQQAIALFIVNEENLKVITDQDEVAPQAGETLISLVNPVS